MMHRVSQLILVWTIQRVAVSQCLTWFWSQPLLAGCHICCHRHLWDHCSIGQLRNLVSRRCLGSHAMHRVRQLILVWARTTVDVSHCLTWFLTWLTLTAYQIRRHGTLWDHRSTGQLKTLVPRRCLGSHTIHGVHQLIVVWTTKRVGVSHCLT